MALAPRVWVTVLAVWGGVVTSALGVAHADPPSFPDLAALGTVNAADYAVQLPNSHPHDPSNAIYFVAEGIPCNFHTGGVGCIGAIPGVADGDRGSLTAVATDTGIRAVGSTPYAEASVEGLPIRSLPAGQSIFVSGTRCGVAAAGVLACKDFQGRGFVISAQSTAWLEHA
jgi:hypothetical protein